MPADWIPMRWPSTWKDASALELVKDTGINCLLIEKGKEFQAVISQAREQGFTVVEPGSLPSEITLVKGLWPGVRLGRTDGGDQFTAGPTGEPWVDSNAWRIRLALARRPGQPVWVDASPRKPWLFAESYLIGVADAAAYGARWIISLDEQLAAGIAGQKPESLLTWRWVTASTKFFATHPHWSTYQPEAVVGIVSSFSGKNEAFNNELLNLVARSNQQYRIILKDNVTGFLFDGLKALIYLDADAPAPALKEQIIPFVQAGGTLITGQMWGDLPGTIEEKEQHPRYTVRVLGKGRLAALKNGPLDPYLVAQDSLVLISHRHDLLRFWNGGAVGSYMTMAPDRKRVLVQVLFYAGARGRQSTVRVAGQYRTAVLSTFAHPEPQTVEADIQKGGIELHLPPVPQYAAVELEI
jgi:hypothetical protein